MYRLSSVFVAFSQQESTTLVSPALEAIIHLLVNGWKSPADLKNILDHNNMGKVEDLKSPALSLLTGYARYILEDHHISEAEYHDFQALKRVFKIKEGDFFEYRQWEVNEILRQQFWRIYADNQVDKEEALEKANLQSLFDLSYAQFEQIKQDEVISALLRGADPLQLDITKVWSFP